MIGSMASIGAVGGTMQNLALYLRLDRQLPQVTIDTTLSLILLGSLVGRLLMGWLADRWPKKRVMLLIYLIVAAAIPPLFYAPTPHVLSLCAFLFGIGLGGDYMIIPLMAAEMYGVAIMGRVMGVVLTADSVSEAVVPMIVAGLRDEYRQLHDRVPAAPRPGADRGGCREFPAWEPTVWISAAAHGTEKGLSTSHRPA